MALGGRGGTTVGGSLQRLLSAEEELANVVSLNLRHLQLKFRFNQIGAGCLF